METYSFLREFADSWFLIFMFVFFVGTAIWLFTPGRKGPAEDAANIPFREKTDGCDKKCDACVCKSDFSKGLIDV